MKVHLAICTPSSGYSKTQFAFSLARMVLEYTQKGVLPEVTEQSIDLFAMEGTGVSANREKMVRQFLKGDGTHLLFIDDDMGFNPNVLHVLFSRRLPIVGCNYRMRTPPAEFMAHRNREEIKTTADAHGVEPVDYLGFGMCLMEKKVLESVPEPRFMINWVKDDYTTEDVAFFYKCPYKPYVDHDASKLVWHSGHIQYTWADDYTEMNKILKSNIEE